MAGRIKNQLRKNQLVLVGVVRRPVDLDIVLKEGWYRMPLRYAPRRRPAYMAFYQTHIFGREGKAIRYYAPVRSYSMKKRAQLLPGEKRHPRADEYYYKLTLGRIQTTPHIIRNKSRRRISFGFTTLAKLKKADRICQLFDIIPIEDIIRLALSRRGIKARHEHCLMQNGHCRYRLDFAIFCCRGKIDLECDNEKWHLTPARRNKDCRRDQFLRRWGWTVLRVSGKEIKQDTGLCLDKVEKAIESLGGVQ